MLRVIAGLSLVGLVGLMQAAAEKKSPITLSEQEKSLLTLTNQERAKEKLPLLEPHPLLMKMARAHSANMARQGKMEHKLDGKAPADRAKAVGYPYARLGENVAWSDGNTLKEIVEGWMESPGHRANILDKRFREIGVGIAKNDKGETYYTQVFGKRLQKD